MPTQTGKTNMISGVYESTCHPKERIILEGQPFPKCAICDRETRWTFVRKTQEPKIGSTGLAELANGALYLICPFCGLNSKRSGLVNPSGTVCDHCKRIFTVASEIDVSGEEAQNSLNVSEHDAGSDSTLI